MTDADTQADSALADHEWITIGNRRWCLTCSGHQWRVGTSAKWGPRISLLCTRDTPYAEAEMQRLRV